MEIKCSKCGSTNVFTETKGTQIGIYCAECGKWIKWGTKNEIRLINHSKEKVDVTNQAILEVREQKEVKSIPISEGATNGDMIKTVFPNVKIKKENIGCKVYFGNGTSSQYFSYKWWNALYVREEM